MLHPVETAAGVTSFERPVTSWNGLTASRPPASREGAISTTAPPRAGVRSSMMAGAARSAVIGLPRRARGRSHRSHRVVVHRQALRGRVLPGALADLEAALLAERAGQRGVLQDRDDLVGH